MRARAATVERRNLDRRSRDRRGQRREAPPEESWFGAFTAQPESNGLDSVAEAADSGAGRPGDAGAALADGEVDADVDADAAAARSPFGRAARRRTGRAPVTSGVGPLAFERLYRAFLSARAVLGAALLATLVAAWLFGVRPTPQVVAISLAYALLALGMWLGLIAREAPDEALPARLSAPRWLACIGADILCFTTLHLLSRSGSFNYAALLVLPVMQAGVLTPRRQGLATAAGVSIVLLAGAWEATLGGGEGTSLLTQAGLAGSGLFVITVLAGELAGRLAREELSAKDSMALARQQAQLNRLVIEEMQDGVLVVDRRGRALAANPAARQLLGAAGMGGPAPFQLRGVAAWGALVSTVERAFVEGVWPEAGRDVLLDFGPAAARTLRVRVRFTRRRDEGASEEFCVLLLEDVRSMQARMRQDKLAAMGRVSAGIAHEIRNPLAAISQANALLSEDATTAGQRQLTRMVADNVERLKRIVDDVMEVAPGAVHDAPTIDVSAHTAADCAEWARAGGLDLPLATSASSASASGVMGGAAAGAPSLLHVDLPALPLGAAFDAEHLRRVLVNLLDNARRHVDPLPGAVRVRLAALDDARLQLSVASDGPPISPEIERYLFEPFFSTRSRGTGLGLYICRELCERYGASIDYRQGPQGASHRNEFVVVMRQKALPALASSTASANQTSLLPNAATELR